MVRHLRAYIVVALALLIIAAVVLAQNAAQSYPSLDASGMQQVAKTSLGTQFDLLLLRLDPAIIDNKRFIRFFILLNNCDQRDGGLKMKNSLSSKFDYQQVSLLSISPKRLRLPRSCLHPRTSLWPTTGGRQPANAIVSG